MSAKLTRGRVVHISVHFFWSSSPRVCRLLVVQDESTEQVERNRESESTQLRACRLLLLHLTVGSAVDLSNCTHERRKLFSRVRSLLVRPGALSEWSGTASALSLRGEKKKRKNRACLFCGDFSDTTWQTSRLLLLLEAVVAILFGAVRRKSVKQVWGREATDVCRRYAAGWGMRAAARHRRPFQRFCCCGVGLVAVIWLSQVIQAPGETLL